MVARYPNGSEKQAEGLRDSIHEEQGGHVDANVVVMFDVEEYELDKSQALSLSRLRLELTTLLMVVSWSRIASRFLRVECKSTEGY